MSDPPSPKTILLGVSGSIAAYKAADLTSKLTKRGHNVFVVLTQNATQFVGAMTFQTLSRNPVTSGVFDERDSWRPTHIDLADRADLFLIAPATANILAKLAHGIADDALTSIALATRAPFLIAPAMNGKMWLNPATQQNVETLKSRGAEFLGPEEGMLACGYEGVGRLWNVDEIAAKADEILLRGRQAPRVVELFRKKNQAKIAKIIDELPTENYSQRNVSYSHDFHNFSHSRVERGDNTCPLRKKHPPRKPLPLRKQLLPKKPLRPRKQLLLRKPSRRPWPKSPPPRRPRNNPLFASRE